MDDSLEIIPVSGLADINSPVSVARLDPSSPVSFIPMADVTETGRWIGNQVRALHEVKGGYTAFQEGDVLFAKITPCMENGKGCHATGLVNGVGFGTT
jgi:type I restriction enzyme, S subunit